MVDIDLNVWGDEWKEGLDRLTATLTAPGRIVRAWGHPVYVRGDVHFAGKRMMLRALDVPAEQFVELRTLVPRSAFASTAGMRVVGGGGLGKIVAQERADAAAFERDHDRIEQLKRHPLRYALYLLALGLLPGAAVVGAVYWFFGRELHTAYDREYEQEPPTETAPALVPLLVRQGGAAGSYEFTATMFDLIRRGVYTAKPVTTERSTWGGLAKQHLADLEISAGNSDGRLTSWERDVSDVMDGVLSGGRSERLSRFRERIEANRATMARHFTAFKDHVAREAESQRWFTLRGWLPLVLALVAFGIASALTFWVVAERWRSVYPRWSDVVLLGVAIAAFLNGLLVLAALRNRAMWRRRSPVAEAEAERWEAFRRYLTDFSRPRRRGAGLRRRLLRRRRRRRGRWGRRLVAPPAGRSLVVLDGGGHRHPGMTP